MARKTPDLPDLTPLPDVPQKLPFRIVAASLAPHVAAGVKALRGWDDLFDVTDADVAQALREYQAIKLG